MLMPPTPSTVAEACHCRLFPGQARLATVSGERNAADVQLDTLRQELAQSRHRSQTLEVRAFAEIQGCMMRL
jgi:hypothetical protein